MMNRTRRLADRVARKVQRWAVPQPAVRLRDVPAIRAGDGLAGQVALVTGGSGEIGGSVCEVLAAQGATVIVTGTSPERTDAICQRVADAGGMAIAQILDVGNADDVERAFAAVAARHGRLDILVASAGGSARGKSAPVIDQEIEVIDAILGVNLRGAILCARAAARMMVPAGRGRIIAISSIIGDHGKAGFAEYAASKAGVNAFIKSLAMEVGCHGVTANCVSPGIVERGGVTPGVAERLARTNWLNSYGTPEDVAHMVAFVASDEAAFVTGQNFIVDGGRSLGLKGD